jgi:polyisoprenoid-binding protein YceI
MTASNTDPTAADSLNQLVGDWRLDPTTTSIDLHTKAMWGLVKVRGSFKATEGRGSIHEDGSFSGAVVIDASSINTKNAKRDDHLRTDDFFDVANYPTFTYNAVTATPDGDGKFTIGGSLTIKEQTLPIELHATITETQPGRIKLDASTEIDRSKWGIVWAKMGAGLKNQIVLAAEFTKS